MESYKQLLEPVIRTITCCDPEKDFEEAVRISCEYSLSSGEVVSLSGNPCGIEWISKNFQ